MQKNIAQAIHELQTEIEGTATDLKVAQQKLANAQAALRRIDKQDPDRGALEREASNLEVWCYACIDKRITLQRVLGLLPA